MRKKFFFIFRILISAGILFVLFKRIDYTKLIDIYICSNKIYIFFGFGAFLLANLVACLRWRFLLCSLGKRISIKEAFSSYFSGLFFNILFPSFIAGDIFRGASISYRHGEMKKVASSIIMDRFNGAMGLILISSIAFIGARKIISWQKVAIPLGLLWIITGVIFLVVCSRRVFSFLVKILGEKTKLKEKLIEFHDQLYFFKQNPVIFLKSICFSIFTQLLTISSFFVVSRGFDLDLGMLYFLIFIPLIMAIVFIPIAIAGFGTREMATVYFFSHVGVDESVATGMSFLNGVFLIFLSLFGGIIYVVLYHRWLQSGSPGKSTKGVKPTTP